MGDYRARNFHSGYLEERFINDSSFRGIMQRQIMGGSRPQRNFGKIYRAHEDPNAYVTQRWYEEDEEGWNPTDSVSAQAKDLYHYVEKLKKVTGQAGEATRQAIAGEAAVVAETLKWGKKRIADWALEEPEAKRPVPEAGFKAALDLSNLRGMVQGLIGSRGTHAELSWADVAAELRFPDPRNPWKWQLGKTYWDIDRDFNYRKAWEEEDPGYRNRQEWLIKEEPEDD